MIITMLRSGPVSRYAAHYSLRSLPPAGNCRLQNGMMTITKPRFGRSRLTRSAHRRSWQYPRDLPLLTPNTPFVSEGWHYDINDAAFWTWRAPQSALLTPLLGGRPQPSKAWHYDFNEASNWQRYPYRTSLTFISFGNPFVSLGWHYDYNDSSLWTWPPPQDRTLYLPVTAVTELHFVGFHVNVGIMINKPQD